MSRFALRAAVPADAEGIARAHVESWQSAYRGILPPNVLDFIDVGQRVESRRRSLTAASSGLHLVAYDRSHGDIVGFCDAGPSRRAGPLRGEIYALYLVTYAKRHGLGAELLERAVAWFKAAGLPSMIIWVLESNSHARGFYAAMGGRPTDRIRSSVAGFPVFEIAYLWDRI